MYKVYVAGDLFDFKHITGNLVLAQHLEKLSNGLYTCILPQNWEGTLQSSIDIRNKDIASVMQADLVLFNFDGADLDSGTMIEFVLAKMLDIPSVLLRTDFRNGGYLFGDDWNNMIFGFPRSVVVKCPALVLNNDHGIDEMHQTIAQSIIKAFEIVLQEKPVLNTYEEIFSAYQHVITMCGSGLDQLVPVALVRKIIEEKIEKRIYGSSSQGPAKRHEFSCNL